MIGEISWVVAYSCGALGASTMIELALPIEPVLPGVKNRPLSAATMVLPLCSCRRHHLALTILDQSKSLKPPDVMLVQPHVQFETFV